MSMTISLAPEVEKRLAERAASVGQDVTEYVHRLIKKDIDLPSFAELFGPVHRAVKDSGIGPTELNSILEAAIVDSRSHGKP